MWCSLFFTIILSLLLATELSAYEQNDYILTTERAAVRDCNQQYVIANASFFKFNRTYTALNFTFDIKRDLGNDVWVKIQAYKFMSNEYRFFPLTFSRDVCHALEKNEFGCQNIYKCGNFSGCPIKKGRYHLCNWGPEYNKFPPYIPAGQYKLDLTFMHSSVEVATLEWYLKIVTPLKIKKE